MSRLISGRIKLALLVLVIIIAVAATACAKKAQPPPAPSANIQQQAKPETIVPVPAAPTQPEQSIVTPPPPPSQPARPPQKADIVVPPMPLPGGQPVPSQQTELLLVVRAFYLEVNGPTDNSMVRDSSIKVEGGTLPGSIVTVNGKIVALDGRGRFSVPIQLEEGPNSIEIIASDARGNQRSRVISIIRLPL